jgi:hypothetical protein
MSVFERAGTMSLNKERLMNLNAKRIESLNAERVMSLNAKRVMSLGGKSASAALCVLFLLAFARAASAEPAQTIIDNGDPQNRVDIVVLGDGYTAAEMSKYTTDVQQFVGSMFQEEPFKEYQRFFNVHRIDVVSAESGADHPENSIFKNTAFDAAYNCGGIQRLICANSSKAANVAANSLPPAERDLIILIVNDSEYGGSGGSIVVASTNQQAVELVLHESGHTFGLLADEYTQSPPTCVNNVEPSEANVTRETDRSAIKWRFWIDPATPVPTNSTTPGLPGLYTGARYCPSGLFRPTFNSKMRSLGQPYEQINAEQLVKRIYNLVSPIDSVEPSAATLSLTTGQQQTFTVTTPSPLTHGISVNWLIDGQQQSAPGSSLTVNSGGLGGGAHTIEALVRDSTPMVRSDPEQLLSDSRRWNVTVVGERIDTTDFFVRQHYLDFLSREADAPGLNFWSNNIESCGANAQCREVKRIDTSAAFFLSIEFKETGYLVYRTYKVAFGDITGKPVPIRLSEFLPDTQSIGQGVVVNSPGWEQALESNKRTYFDSFVARARFAAAYPQTLTPEQFVDGLDHNAGGVLSPQERDSLVTDLKSNARTRAQVLRAVAEDADTERREFNRAFVLMQYFGYLRRNPDDAPNTDFSGYQFWLTKLDSFGGDWRAAEMVKAFISSTEYRARFAQP